MKKPSPVAAKANSTRRKSKELAGRPLKLEELPADSFIFHGQASPVLQANASFNKSKMMTLPS